MKINKELELAWNFVEKTNKNIFLTGKAGTGKTTFLRKIKNESKKRLVVVAPTGVAAINAKGVTIHSFFQMPFGPIIPGREQQQSAYKFNKTKINIIKSLDLLVIDEISMVRADLLDGIDQVLRKYKNRNKEFGGVQLLLIGDLQQLSPVVRPNEWDLLKGYYENAYFFSSLAYKLSNPVGIELKQIYRQDDDVFINILNEIRNNSLTETSAKTLNKRFLPKFEAKEGEDYIILTTHNKRADNMNQIAFDKLETKSRIFKAEIHGKFPEFSYPSQEVLKLKIGAQVMFTKNDTSFEKKYFNGKIGEIIALSKDEVIVKSGVEEITVEPEIWENISYSMNADTKEIEEKKAGSFKQIPLKLAWAITIHKSQGLTFEKAIIDAESSFAHGQTYVALSRCKTLEGIVLKTKIKPSSIISDTRVQTFTKYIENNLPNEKTLCDAEKEYQLSLIVDLFSYYQILYPCKRILDIFYKGSNSIQGNIMEKIPFMITNIEKLLPIATKFNQQIVVLSQEVSNIEASKSIQERLKKANDYFLKFTKDEIEKPFNELTLSSNNKELKKTLRFHQKNLKEQLKAKIYCLKGSTPFSTSKYLDLRAKSVLLEEKITKEKDVYEFKTEQTELLDNLKAYRNIQSNNLKIDLPNVFSNRSLYEMANEMPATLKQLRKIKGMGKVRIEAYGEELIKIIKNYCSKNKLPIKADSIEMDRPKKGSSQMFSLELFNKKMSIEEIAIERELTVGTITSHLAQFIATGELEASKLMNATKFEELKTIMKNTKFEGFGDLKSKIDDKWSYSDIKIVYNGIEFEKIKEIKK